jgi:uncharacterized protein
MICSICRMRSVVLSAVFSGCGLCLCGQASRVRQMALVAAVITAQLLASPWRLACYRFGPVGWLWRSLSYRRWQSMRLPRPG